jgi:phenylacetate-CoA ligase
MAYQHWKELQSHTLPDEYFERRASLTAEEIREIQDMGLMEQYALAFEAVPFYREKLSQWGLGPDSVKGLDDLNKLPFTTVDEIRPDPARGHTTEQLMAEPQHNISLIHSSSGTTGAPKLFGYTGGDIAKWAADSAFMLWIAGFRKEDIVACAMPFGQFTGGPGLYLGYTALGVTYIPLAVTPGVTDRIIAHFTGKMRIGEREILLDPLQQANGYLALSSFIPRLLEILDQRGISPQELLLTKIVTGGEPSSDALRDRIKQATGIQPRDVFGLGEFYGPGNAAECSAGDCLHVISDEWVAEVIDPETGEPTPEGEMGELVLTSLHKEAFPLLRYRTGDRTRALPQRCDCGMAHYRISRVPGRIDADDIIMPGGVAVNRIFFEEVLLRVDGAGAEYAVTVAEHPVKKGLRRLYIAIEGDQDSKARIAQTISQRVQLEYKQRPVVEVVKGGTIPRGMGKARRLVSAEDFVALVGGHLPEE